MNNIVHVVRTRPDIDERRWTFILSVNSSRTLEKKRGLGKQGNASFYLVEDVATKQQYTLKVIQENLNDLETGKIKDHLQMIRNSGEDSHFAKVHEAYWYRASNTEQKLFIVCEYYPHGSLDDYLSVLELANASPSEQTIRSPAYVSQTTLTGIAIDVLSALHLLHSRPTPLVHRNVCQETCKIVSYNDETPSVRVVLCDVESSREVGAGTEAITNAYYSAPEIGHNISPLVDIWSLGVILYELMTLQKSTSENCIQCNIKDEYSQKVHEQMRQKLENLRYSPEMIELVLRMLSYDPKKRLPADVLLRYLTSYNDLSSNEIRDLSVDKFIRKLNDGDKEISRVQECEYTPGFQHSVLSMFTTTGIPETALQVVQQKLDKTGMDSERVMKLAHKYSDRNLILCDYEDMPNVVPVRLIIAPVEVLPPSSNSYFSYATSFTSTTSLRVTVKIHAVGIIIGNTPLIWNEHNFVHQTFYIDRSFVIDLPPTTNTCVQQLTSLLVHYNVHEKYDGNINNGTLFTYKCLSVLKVPVHFSSIMQDYTYRIRLIDGLSITLPTDFPVRENVWSNKLNFDEKLESVVDRVRNTNKIDVRTVVLKDTNMIILAFKNGNELFSEAQETLVLPYE